MDCQFATEVRRLVVPLPVILLFTVLSSVSLVGVAADEEEGSARALSGISIVGNNEAPKSLFIVPWKSSTVGSGPGFSSGMLDDALGPVDREVFLREVEFFEVRSANR